MRIVSLMKLVPTLLVSLLCTPLLAGCEGSCPELETELRTRKAEARELVVATGCSTVERCDALPMGVRACGGPQEYVVFCRDTTDVPALESRLGEIDRIEHGYNVACGIASICILVAAPELVLNDGRCEPVR